MFRNTSRWSAIWRLLFAQQYRPVDEINIAMLRWHCLWMALVFLLPSEHRLGKTSRPEYPKVLLEANNKCWKHWKLRVINSMLIARVVIILNSAPLSHVRVTAPNSLLVQHRLPPAHPTLLNWHKLCAPQELPVRNYANAVASDNAGLSMCMIIDSACLHG